MKVVFSLLVLVLMAYLGYVFGQKGLAINEEQLAEVALQMQLKNEQISQLEQKHALQVTELATLNAQVNQMGEDYKTLQAKLTEAEKQVLLYRQILSDEQDPISVEGLQARTLAVDSNKVLLSADIFQRMRERKEQALQINFVVHGKKEGETVTVPLVLPDGTDVVNTSVNFYRRLEISVDLPTDIEILQLEVRWSWIVEGKEQQESDLFDWWAIWDNT